MELCILYKAWKKSNDIPDLDTFYQSDSEIRNFSILLQPDSFSKLQAEDEKAASEPKSPTIIHAKES